VNIFRDLRWGRGHETYGEDPFLTGRIGSAFVRGIQGDDARYLKAAACAKHFAVHSGPEATRHAFDATVSEEDLHETYLPAFETLVRDAQVECVMCSYNRINGVPACASANLLTTVLRGQWEFNGYVVSDCGALFNISGEHGYADSPEAAAALALRAGVGINCGSLWAAHLQGALDLGLVTEADLDRTLSVTLPTLFRLGLFDPQGSTPWDGLSPSVVGSMEHGALAREAAQKSIVLLKNNGALPLSTDLPGIAVIGPAAASIEVLLGNYHGLSAALVTPLEGISEAVNAGTTIEYHIGVQVDRGEVLPGSWPVYRSQQMNAIIAIVGLSPLLEGEAGETVFIDEADAIELPPHQVDLVRYLRDGYDGPLIVVVAGGSPRAIREIHDVADAVLWMGYPGQEGGRAVADILFGRVSPSGRLPVTVPFSTGDVPPFEDYNMSGRTYRFMQAPALYPFGFGLSYGSVSYSDLILEQSVLGLSDTLVARVKLENRGPRAIEEVVQMYVADDADAESRPRTTLVGFSRVTLASGETREVPIRLLARDFPGSNSMSRDRADSVFELMVGGSSPSPRSRELGAPRSVSARVTLVF
jgi:beta-glucosidase